MEVLGVSDSIVEKIDSNESKLNIARVARRMERKHSRSHRK